MKVYYTYSVIKMILWTSLVVGATSCGKESINEEEELSPIYLAGVVQTSEGNALTKGDSTESDGFTTDDEIGLFAYRTGNKTWEQVGSTTTPNLMYNQKVTKTTDGWVYSPIRYWIPTYMYSFFAYAPYDAPGVSFSGNEVTGSPYLQVTTPLQSKDQIDLKSATCFNRMDDGWPVNLPFRHALTRLRFSAKATANENYYQAYITGITIAGINTSGILTLDSGVWSNQQTPDTITVLDQEDANDDTEFYYVNPSWETTVGMAYVIPQQITGGELTIYYSIVSPFEENPIDRQATLSLDGTEYTRGKSLNYLLTIRLTGIAFTVQVEDWNMQDAPGGIYLE